MQESGFRIWFLETGYFFSKILSEFRKKIVAQHWNFVSGGNQEWNLERVDPTVQQTRAKAEEAHDPEPTPSQRKHQNDLVRKLNNAGKGRAGRKA